MSDWWNQPMGPTSPGPEGEGSGSGEAGQTTCPWCSAAASPDLACCPCCGAVMAQRESLGGLVIPGVTDVDAGLAEPSLVGSMLGTQARMNALGGLGQAGGAPAQLGGATVLLARDSFAGMFHDAPKPADVGRPSQAALDMASRLGVPVDKASSATGDEAAAGWTEPKEPA